MRQSGSTDQRRVSIGLADPKDMGIPSEEIYEEAPGSKSLPQTTLDQDTLVLASAA
ncbi:hypothetical protein [Steroidobacter cummioxidans]|uniref:hypothetical protein n=1 Tax=Steroidobacter cummioxidans TaxID=1803913 RepID=UPI00137A0BAA|nr:hypothetical protein [Steroidobacter cummioxidans]